MSGTIVRHRFSLSGGTRAVIRMAVLYLECRPLSPRERPTDRGLFDRTTDGITRTAATSDLVAVATNRLAYHRLILSPRYDAATMDRDALLRWTRHVLADLERQQGRQLVWVAAVHRHTTHPHVHVLVGATARSADGTRTTVRFSPTDYATLRGSGDRWAKQAADDHALLREVERYLSVAATTFAIGLNRRGSGGDQSRDEDDEEERRRESRRR